MNSVAKIKAILSSIVTYIVLIQSGLVIFADEISGLFSDGQAQDVVKVILMAVAILGAILNIIRRVTVVLPEQRGILLPERAPSVVVLRKHPDRP